MTRTLLLFVSLLITSSALLASEKCKLPKDTGPCKAYLPMFYYDTVSGNCKEFVYGGCQGNENQFNTLKECESECRGYLR